MHGQWTVLSSQSLYLLVCGWAVTAKQPSPCSPLGSAPWLAGEVPLHPCLPGGWARSVQQGTAYRRSACQGQRRASIIVRRYSGSRSGRGGSGVERRVQHKQRAGQHCMVRTGGTGHTAGDRGRYRLQLRRPRQTHEQ